MSDRPRPSFKFVAATLPVALLALCLLKTSYDLDTGRERARVQGLLDTVAVDLLAELERQSSVLSGRSRAPPRSAWHAWELTGERYVVQLGSPLVIAEPSLRQRLATLEERPPDFVLLGPFATPRNGNAVTLAMPVTGGSVAHAGGAASMPLAWRGRAASIDELMNLPGLAELVRRGYRVRLTDADTGIALYQSADGAVVQPLQRDIPVPGAHLQLAAAPSAGWAMPARWWGTSLLILLGTLLWVANELRRGRELKGAQGDLEEADQRRKEANLQYGKALESVGALEARLHVVSMYDTVTGLANRSSLVRRIESALDALRQGPNGILGLLSIGFDHVHHITNSFGADFASRVLVVAAERVEFVLPSRDLLFRIGDFQLAVVVLNAAPGACERLAARIIEEVEAPISMDNHTFMLHPSIGIAETPSGYQYAEALLDRAATALNAIPQDALLRYCVFDSGTAKESVSRLQLEVDLNKAFDGDQFVLEFEPIVRPVSHAVAGFEALIRWNHPTEGRLSPGRFLPVAVQAGLSHRLNSWVMREAARQAAIWRQAGYQDLFINFNLSAEAFLRPNLEEEIGAILAEFDLPGECLLVELTESTLIQDLRGAARTLQRLSELGIRAWLDDFGTGYSSLSYLRALPLRGVKIDRSFIERTVIDARDFGFVKSLIDLISYLGMQSIAEGIETQGQYELLSLTTCDLYQGWHFAHGMPAAQAEAWMNERGMVGRREKIA